MKKITLMAVILAILIYSYPAFTKDTPMQEYTKIKQKLEKAREENDHSVAPLTFVDEYVDSNGNLICMQEGVKPGFMLLNKEFIEPLQLLTLSDIHTRCFSLNTISWDKFVDTSDECILERRNHKEPSKVCWFDYKRFLPSNSKIDTDKEFMDFVRATKLLIRDKYCDRLQEITTAEREECKEKAKLFITQLSTKTAPHCRDVVTKEYNELLEAGKEVFKIVDNTQINNAFGQKLQFETFAYQAIYGNAYAQAFMDKLQGLSYANFCTTEGFEADMKKLQSQTKPKRAGNVIELN